MTITIPEELSAKLAALTGEERKRRIKEELADGEYAATIHESILEALAEAELANRFTEEEDRTDMIAAINEGLADIESGRTVSLEEELARWEIMKAELLARSRK